jgi:E3 ubiquitin-protein ligase HUWE1
VVTERTTQSTLHTLLLSAFYRRGGLDSICDICRMFIASIKWVSDIKMEERSAIATKELIHAYGGLKVALHLIRPLVSSKPIFESGQTLLVMSRDKKDTDPDYFEPHNFLVRVRLTTLPLLRELWDASWLVSAPLSVSRSVVQLVMEVIGAENEEPKGEPVDLALHTSSGNSVPPGPDEGRIRQLTDMGFPRSAAERALTRTRNNVEAATELLLVHPFPLPPDPDPETDDEVLELAPSDDANAPPEPQVNAEVTPIAHVEAPDTLPGPHVDDKPVIETKTAEEWRTTLNEARDALKPRIAPQALRLIDEHFSLVFDLQAAFVRSDSHQEQAVRSLVDDIKSFSPHAYDVQEQPLANRCRLLALVLARNRSSLSLDAKNSLLDSLLALLLSSPVGMDDRDQPTTPKWLPTHLLVIEALLMLGEQPRPITLPKEGENIVAEDILTGPTYAEARGIVFDFCLRLLAIPSLPSDDLLSVLRLFVLLTRDYQMACQFVKRDGVTLLFSRLKMSSVSGSHSYIAIILRHIVEDQAALQLLMRQLLKRYFSQPRTRMVDVDTYLRNCSAMALRNPGAFIQVTESTCQLTQPFSVPHHITVKSDAGPITNSDPKFPLGDESGTADMLVEPKSDSPSANEAAESIVHFLISELMSAVKTTESMVDSSTANPTPTVTPGQADTGNSSKEEPLEAKGERQDSYTYSYFLMQCLTELLFSYDSCKIAFLSYSAKKRSQTPAKEATTKHRTAALTFLLSDVISIGTIHLHSTEDARNRVTMANLATSVLLALCVDSSPTPDLKDLSPDIISVRKFVLEAISRAIKEVPQLDSADARYGRLLALADLCHRLLTVRVTPPTRKQSQDELPTHIAKVMLEKNFVATLTNALSEVDLNYPNVKSVVVSILKPLEYLYVTL